MEEEDGGGGVVCAWFVCASTCEMHTKSGTEANRHLDNKTTRVYAKR